MSSGGEPRRSLSRRGWVGLLLAGGAAFGLLVLTTGQVDEAASWDLELDRRQAVETTREMASGYGLQTDDWELRARAERLEEGPGAPLGYLVELRDGNGIGSFDTAFRPDGRLARLEVKPSRAGRPLDETQARELAEVQLRRLVGEEAPAFQLFFEDQPRSGVYRYRWSREEPGGGPIRIAEVDLRGDRVERLVLGRRSAAGEDAPEDKVGFRLDLEDAGLVVLVLALLVYLGQALFYRQLLRPMFTFGALVALTELARVAFLAEGLRERPDALALFFRPVLLHGVIAALLLGAGLVAARRFTPALVWPFEEFLRGRLWSGSVAASVAFGLLAGVGAVTLVALAAWAASAAAVTTLLRGHSTDLAVLASPWPALGAWLPRLPLAVVAQFAFLVPVLHATLRRPWAARPAAVALGTVLFAAQLISAEPLGMRLAAGLVLAVTLDLVHHRGGLLAVLAAGVGAAGARELAALAVQSGPLAWQGWLGAIGLLAVAGAFAAASRRPGVNLLDPRDLGVPRRLRAQRERIKAQLSVAREAQMRMLPARPPELPGLSIAASCRPAREVGGDLYDFIPLEDGRWAVTVGDVSGKGMVASLYMTLTKGLLLAAAEHLTSARTALGEVNKGLYRQCDKSTFVTLWYGILDPGQGSLTYLRAGHNPPLLRRAARNGKPAETVPLRPPGLGLGLADTPIFDGVAKEETLKLAPGDALFVYSDGLPEAMDPERQEYGDDRLAAAVARTDGLSAEQARDAILADVTAFMGSAPQHDDMTLVVLRLDQVA